MAKAKKRSSTRHKQPIQSRIKQDPQIGEALQEATNRISSGDFQVGMQICQSILARSPDHPGALYLLGIVAMETKQHQAAADLFQQAIEHDAPYAQYFNMLGMAQFKMELFEKAEQNLKQAIRQNPNFETAHNNLGCLYQMTKQLEEASRCFENAVGIRPSYIEARHNLGIVLLSLGKLDRATNCFEKVLEKHPESASDWCHLGLASFQKGLKDEAKPLFMKALELDPYSAHTHTSLGTLYKQIGQHTKAMEHYREAIRLEADENAFNDLGNTLNDLGRHQESYATFKQLFASRRDVQADSISNFLFGLNYNTALDPEEIFREHVEWGKELSAAVATLPPPAITHDNGSPIKVGYVSSDFREHSVAFFIESILTRHNPKRFTTYCYSDVDKADAVTERLQAEVAHWRNIFRMKREDAAALIRRDGIDILIDLGGHTGGNRLTTFAAKPVPIQASYLGYPNTTGLPEMDYRITDKVSDPPGVAETYHTETLARLDSCFLCYTPLPSTPAVSEAPLIQEGRVSFGCFNSFWKFNEKLTSIWAEILKEVPDSRLILKNKSLADPDACQRLQDQFQDLGIDPQRIEMHGNIEDIKEHLELYNRVDIALDTSPYNGTTTTFEALWMGVPVITLAGPTHVSRVSASILSHLNKPELIAESEADYCNKAVSLANDPEAIKSYRANMQSDLQQSGLLDAERITAELEALYESWVSTYRSSRLEKEEG